MTPQPVRSPSPALRRDDGENGQVMPLAVFLFLLMAALVFLVYNTGVSVNARIQAQNAADVAAHGGAVWTARGLNLISANNQGETRILASIILTRALDPTLNAALLEIQRLRARAGAMIAAGLQQNNPILVARGRQLMADAQAENDVLDAIRASFPTATIDSLAADQTGTLWSAMRSLESFSQALIPTVAGVAQSRAIQLGRWNTDGQGTAVLLSPSWIAFPDGLTPAEAPAGDSSSGLPVRPGEFNDWAAPLQSSAGRSADGGARTVAGPLTQGRGQLRSFFAAAMPLSTDNGRIYVDFVTAEYDRLFSDPGPQPWMPVPFVLYDDIRAHGPAIASGADLRSLGIWSVAARRSLAPFWTHRFVNPVPDSLATATARAKVVNGVGWDLFTPTWQAKLTHADWTYDRVQDPTAVGPEKLAAALDLMIRSGRFDLYFQEAVPVADARPLGGTADPAATQAALQLLSTLATRSFTWDPAVGQALNTH